MTRVTSTQDVPDDTTPSKRKRAYMRGRWYAIADPNGSIDPITIQTTMKAAWMAHAGLYNTSDDVLRETRKELEASGCRAVRFEGGESVFG